MPAALLLLLSGGLILAGVTFLYLGWLAVGILLLVEGRLHHREERYAFVPGLAVLALFVLLLIGGSLTIGTKAGRIATVHESSAVLLGWLTAPVGVALRARLWQRGLAAKLALPVLVVGVPAGAHYVLRALVGWNRLAPADVFFVGLEGLLLMVCFLLAIAILSIEIVGHLRVPLASDAPPSNA